MNCAIYFLFLMSINAVEINGLVPTEVTESEDPFGKVSDIRNKIHDKDPRYHRYPSTILKNYDVNWDGFIQPAAGHWLWNLTAMTYATLLQVVLRDYSGPLGAYAHSDGGVLVTFYYQSSNPHYRGFLHHKIFYIGGISIEKLKASDTLTLEYPTGVGSQPGFYPFENTNDILFETIYMLLKAKKWPRLPREYHFEENKLGGKFYVFYQAKGKA